MIKSKQAHETISDRSSRTGWPDGCQRRSKADPLATRVVWGQFSRAVDNGHDCPPDHREQPRAASTWITPPSTAGSQRFTPLPAEAARPCRHGFGHCWQVDETDVKVAGPWRDVDRAIDQFSQVIDVLVSRRRDAAAARRCFLVGHRHNQQHAERSRERAKPIQWCCRSCRRRHGIVLTRTPTTTSRPITVASRRGCDRRAACDRTAAPRSSPRATRLSRKFGAGITSWRLGSRTVSWLSRSTNSPWRSDASPLSRPQACREPTRCNTA
jgi:hypothetical protein